MPFYTYKCPSCNVEEEILQSINASTPNCKKCDNASVGIHVPKMKRIFKPNAKPGSKDGSWGFGGKSK